MPSKNTLKTYAANAYYHVYNRGVEKRNIFLDEQDCIVFLHYLKLYLSPVEELKKLNNLGMRTHRFIPLNLSTEIDLLSFSLMPNHIHLQVKQYTRDAMTKLMRRLLTSYAMYFNKKYKRVGVLFQGRYKAAIIETDIYHLHLSRYIHLNPQYLTSNTVNFANFSSYLYYLGKKQAGWIKPQEILSFFRTAIRKDLKDIFSYQSFVEDYREDSRTILGDLVLEED
ncbi:MAG: transposase [Candidatus Levybacteria bacterium]|nr:transposase [Candidatus Levybacteria bacterium]